MAEIHEGGLFRFLASFGSYHPAIENCRYDLYMFQGLCGEDDLGFHGRVELAKKRG